MPTVLLTGAAGFLGQHLARELLASGAQVRALSRRPASDPVLAALGALPVRGDVTDPASLAAAMTGVEAVFHAAADTNTWRPNNAFSSGQLAPVGTYIQALTVTVAGARCGASAIDR